jgi:hypothetical protein
MPNYSYELFGSLKKLWIVHIFSNLYNLYIWYPLTIINFISLFMQATHIISHKTKGYTTFEKN